MAGPQTAGTKKILKRLNLFIYLLFHFTRHSIRRPTNRAAVGMRTFVIVESISYFHSFCFFGSLHTLKNNHGRIFAVLK